MNRRSFMQSILAAGVVPWVVTTAGALIPVRKIARWHEPTFVNIDFKGPWGIWIDPVDHGLEALAERWKRGADFYAGYENSGWGESVVLTEKYKAEQKARTLRMRNLMDFL